MTPHFKATIFFVMVFAGILNRGFGDQPAAQPIAEWISPHGTYLAKMELVQAPGFVRLTVEPSKEDKTVVSLVEQFNVPATAPLSQAFRGLWSQKEDQFCLFSWDPADITGRLVTIQTPVSYFSGDKELPQFVISKTYSPVDAMQSKIDEVSKRMPSLCPPSQSMQLDGSQIISGGWQGDDRMEAVMEVKGTAFDLKGGKAENVFIYKATWKTTFQLTLEGFKLIATEPTKVTKTNKQTKKMIVVKDGG
jgi:hypothetical protein